MKTRIYILTGIVALLSSCTLTVDPSTGVRTWTMNGEEVGKAIIVLSQK